MALPLEETIMNEIGLGAHYNWFNGSGSCQYIRQEAAKKVTEVIKKHHEAGDQIALPDEKLIGVLVRISNIGDTSQYSLTNTWIAASYVIAQHIHYAGSEEPERREAYDSLGKYLEENYLPRHRSLSHDLL